MEYEYLDRLNSPEDLKCFRESEIPALAADIRKFILASVSENGGHLASNLGVVEMTLAIHRVFSVPADHLIFDVGHQCYTHKIITGRKNEFSSLRRPGGLSGFENRSESPYDCFGTGHSSTSISAALGFAEADKLAGRDNYTIAVVGDGAYTGGMIHEALNNCRPDLRLIIILNENEMSISKNIGSFAEYIAKIRASTSYYDAKRRTVRFLRRIPIVGRPMFKAIRKLKCRLKARIYGSNYFEELGLYYLGPADGNDYPSVVRLLKEAKSCEGSVVIHLKTKKGKGFEKAELRPDVFHSFSPVAAKSNYSEMMGDILCGMAENDSKIGAITAAMCEGTGLSRFEKKFPDRFFDVGIAEPHALTFAAGLAANGMRPYFAVYSSFLQRGYDNIIHDIALQNLPVTICVDRAGLSRADGATHHGIFDVAFLSHIPNIKIYCPSSYLSLELALKESERSESPIAIRYANASEDPEIIERFGLAGADEYIDAASDFTVTEYKSKIIVTYGTIVSEAIKACDMLRDCGIILLQKLKPYDVAANAVSELLPENDCDVVFLEEGIKAGGAGEQLGMHLHDDRIRSYSVCAIDDKFAPKKYLDDYFESFGISAKDIVCAFDRANAK